jgi:hypothetical protein
MTPPAGGVPVDCTQPIDAATLMDYWLGILPSTEEDPIEEHLMGCDRCGDQLREAIALADSLRTLARSGSLLVVLSDQFVTRAGEMGQRVRETTTCSSLVWPPIWAALSVSISAGTPIRALNSCECPTSPSAVTPARSFANSRSLWRRPHRPTP